MKIDLDFFKRKTLVMQHNAAYLIIDVLIARLFYN